MQCCRQYVRRGASFLYRHRRRVLWVCAGGAALWFAAASASYLYVVRPYMLERLRLEKLYFTPLPRRTRLYVAGDAGNASLPLEKGPALFTLTEEEYRQEVEKERKRKKSGGGGKDRGGSAETLAREKQESKVVNEKEQEGKKQHGGSSDSAELQDDNNNNNNNNKSSNSNNAMTKSDRGKTSPPPPLAARARRFYYYYVYTAYRLLLACVRALPLVWYAFLTYYVGSCSEQVLVDKLKHFLTSMGPSFIKLGQWLASRPDVFPRVLCEGLESLYDDTPPHAWSYTLKQLTETPVDAAAMRRDARNAARLESDSNAGGWRGRRKSVLKSNNHNHNNDNNNSDHQNQREDSTPNNNSSTGKTATTSAKVEEYLSRTAAEATEPAAAVIQSPSPQPQLKQQQKQKQQKQKKPMVLLDCLTDISPTPLNSGSIAQVHLARLAQPLAALPAGAAVVVKVTHPNIEETVAADLRAMRFLIRAAEFLFPRSFEMLDLQTSLREFALLLFSQMNLLVECDNLQQFYANFRDVDGIIFPRAVPQLCSPKVLVETYESGIPVSQLVSQMANDNNNQNQNQDSSSEEAAARRLLSLGRRKRRENEDIAALGCEMFLKMLFEDNFVHSDLHPGNVLVRDNRRGVAQAVSGSSDNNNNNNNNLTTSTTTSNSNITTNNSNNNNNDNNSNNSNNNNNSDYGRYPNGKRVLPRELIILDAGLVTSLSREERRNFISLFAAVAAGDGELGADLMLDRLPAAARARVGGSSNSNNNNNNNNNNTQGNDGTAVTGAAAAGPPPISEEQRAQFRAEMKQVFDMVKPRPVNAPENNDNNNNNNNSVQHQKVSGGFTLQDVRLGDVLSRVLSTVRACRVPLDGHFSTLVLTVIVGEGLGRQMVPDFDLFQQAAPRLAAYLDGGELTRVAAALRATYDTPALLATAAGAAGGGQWAAPVAVFWRRAIASVQRLHDSGEDEDEEEDEGEGY